MKGLPFWASVSRPAACPQGLGTLCPPQVQTVGMGTPGELDRTPALSSPLLGLLALYTLFAEACRGGLRGPGPKLPWTGTLLPSLNPGFQNEQHNTCPEGGRAVTISPTARWKAVQSLLGMSSGCVQLDSPGLNDGNK